VPELPELEVYAENLAALVVGRVVRAVDVRSVFTVRTVEPPLASCVGRAPTAVARRDKHLVVSFPHAHVIVHMKLSGRLRWKPPAEKLNAKIGCVKIDFDHGSLHMTEASSRKSASVHVVRDVADCAEVGRGVEPLGLAPGSLREVLSRANRRLKGALTDPRVLAGIGNAYSDEILFDARLSPLKLTRTLADDEWARLVTSVPRVLAGWTSLVRERAAGALPTEQDLWRRDMKVHGKFKSPCPSCGGRIERIAYADSETHYCPGCQTGGRKLSDRRLDRLLR